MRLIWPTEFACPTCGAIGHFQPVGHNRKHQTRALRCPGCSAGVSVRPLAAVSITKNGVPIIELLGFTATLQNI